jgi:hypothetical protein
VDAADQGVVGLRAEAEGVRSRRERAHGAFLDSDAGADRPHLQRVGDRETAEAQLPPEQVRQDLAA